MLAPPDVSRPPIPEPNAPPADGGFTLALWPMLPYSMWAWPVIGLILLDGRPQRASSLVAFAIAGVALVVSNAVFCFLFRTRVTQDGIRSYDAWSRVRALRWDEAVSIRPRRILNLRYLWLRSERGAPLWLPLFLRDTQGFRAAVHRHAPPNHPLREALKLPTEQE